MADFQVGQTSYLKSYQWKFVSMLFFGVQHDWQLHVQKHETRWCDSISKQQIDLESLLRQTVKVITLSSQLFMKFKNE